jgi:hypothetical protein
MGGPSCLSLHSQLQLQYLVQLLRDQKLCALNQAKAKTELDSTKAWNLPSVL